MENYSRSESLAKRVQNNQLKTILLRGELDWWFEMINRHEIDTLLEREEYFDSLPSDLSKWSDLDLEISYWKCVDLIKDGIDVSKEKEQYRQELLERGVFDGTEE